MTMFFFKIPVRMLTVNLFLTHMPIQLCRKSVRSMHSVLWVFASDLARRICWVERRGFTLSFNARECKHKNLTLRSNRVMINNNFLNRSKRNRNLLKLFITIWLHGFALPCIKSVLPQNQIKSFYLSLYLLNYAKTCDELLGPVSSLYIICMRHIFYWRKMQW